MVKEYYRGIEILDIPNLLAGNAILSIINSPVFSFVNAPAPKCPYDLDQLVLKYGAISNITFNSDDLAIFKSCFIDGIINDMGAFKYMLWPKCECGASKVKSSIHSSWCPVK